MVHYSTDYVFSGELTDRESYKNGYPEEAPTNPVNRYGATKLEGEQAVKGFTFRTYCTRILAMDGTVIISSKLSLIELRV